MKQKNKTTNVVITILMVIFFAAAAQLTPAAKAQKFRVTKAVLKPNVVTTSGKCPVRVNFTGYITANAAGKVKYTFTRNDGAIAPVYILEFKKAGTQRVETDWTLGDVSILPVYEGWQAIRILSPNEMESSHEAGAFAIKCDGGSTEQTPKKADLVIEGAKISLAQICKSGSPVLYADVVVKNIGTAASTARSDVGLVQAMNVAFNWGNGVGLPSLAPGAIETVQIPIYYLIDNPAQMNGSHEFKIRVNVGSWIEESNMSNNEYGSIRVELPAGFCGK